MIEIFDMQFDFTSPSGLAGISTTILMGILTFRERRLRMKSDKIDILDKLQEFLKDDITQVFEVNKIIKIKLKEREEYIKELKSKLKEYEINKKL